VGGTVTGNGGGRGNGRGRGNADASRLTPRSGADAWSAVTALADRSRRTLFDYVRHARRPVSREDAAAATHMSRNLAAFHLDKLVEAGLLAARYEAPAGPRGRGRTPKTYVPSGDGLAVTIPERRYELMAEILADGMAAGSVNAVDEAHRQAYERGKNLGTEVAEPGRDCLPAALGSLGFEPERNGPRTMLHNCPFHALAARHTQLICGLNHSFLRGLADGLAANAEIRLEASPGNCCVQFVAK
jgi:predicted ArsR family transcriptional regulator